MIFLILIKKLGNKTEAQQLGQSLLPPIVFYLCQNWSKKFLKKLIVNHIYGEDNIFFIWEHREEKLRNFAETLNEIHPTIKLTAE